MEKSINNILLISISLMLNCCIKSDKAVSDDIKYPNDSIQTKINKEISNNKNQIVFLSFYPNMSNEVFEYLLEKEKINKSIIKPQRNIFEYIYQIPIKDKTIDFSIHNLENAIELNHRYDYFAEEVNDFEIKKGMQNSLNIIEELVKLYKTKYPKFEVKRNIIGNRSIETKYFMNGSVDYLIFYDAKKIIVFNTSFDGNPFRIRRENNTVLVYSYSIDIKYYSINSFNKMRDDKINDSLEYIKNHNDKEKLKRDMELKKNEKTLNEI
jgi:hypothetical protein